MFKDLINRIINIVSNETELQQMNYTKLETRKEKYSTLKKSYDEKYDEYCKGLDKEDFQQFTNDTKNDLTKIIYLENYIDTALKEKSTKQQTLLHMNVEHNNTADTHDADNEANRERPIQY